MTGLPFICGIPFSAAAPDGCDSHAVAWMGLVKKDTLNELAQ
jgi:hypothetical protein